MEIAINADGKVLIANETGEVKEYTAVVNFNRDSDTINRSVTIIKGHQHPNNDNVVITGLARAVDGFLTCGSDGYVKRWTSSTVTPMLLATERRLQGHGDDSSSWVTCLGMTSSVHISYGVSDSSTVKQGGDGDDDDGNGVKARPSIGDVSDVDALVGIVAVVVTSATSKKSKKAKVFIQGTIIINIIIIIIVIIIIIIIIIIIF